MKWRANMNYNKFKEILRTKFSKKEIEDLLGDKIYSAIVEWTDSEEAYTQTSLVELLVSITGYGIFQKKMFRKRFFRCIPFETLKELLNDNHSTYEELASKAAKIEFSNNEFYQKLFVEYFECPEYDFIDYVPEAMLETLSGTQEKFYELFDYQYLIKQQAVYELDKKTPLGRKVLIHMPTGTGKTKTTMHILAHYLNFINKNGLVLWVAHTKELLGQALETFSNVWNHLGLGEICVEKSWGNGEYTITRGMVFITIQALQSMRSLSPDEYLSLCNRTTLMVYDECHKIGAEETNKVVTEFTTSTEGNRKFFIGLTATPGRTTIASLENRIFNEFFDRKIEIDINLVERISKGRNQAFNSSTTTDVIRYFQQRKILSVLIKEQLDYEASPDLIESLRREAASRREEYTETLIKKLATNKARNTVILNKLRELNRQGKPTIVFACSLDHAKMLSAFLNIENIPNSLVYGDMLPSVRKQAIANFKKESNSTNIIINYDILTTGFDSTNIECVFITRPTKSVILYSQMIGRGLRGPQMGGGETCLLIDVKDNLEAYNENEAFSHFNSYWR